MKLKSVSQSSHLPMDSTSQQDGLQTQQTQQPQQDWSSLLQALTQLQQDSSSHHSSSHDVSDMSHYQDTQEPVPVHVDRNDVLDMMRTTIVNYKGHHIDSYSDYIAQMTQPLKKKEKKPLFAKEDNGPLYSAGMSNKQIAALMKASQQNK